MAQAPESTLTPQAAIETLRTLEAYEERLTLKAAGLTTMIWGIAVPGIFMTYIGVGGWLEAHGLEWVYSLLWVPWIVTATVATGGIWNAHAISVRQSPNDKDHSWLLTGLFVLIFFAIALVVLGLERAFQLELDSSTVATFAGGGLTAAIGLLWSVKKWTGGALMVAAGFVIFGVAAGMAFLGLEGVPAGVVGGLVSMLAYFTVGLTLYHRG